MSTNGPESLLDVDELTQLVYRAMETGQLDAALSFAKQGLVKEPDHGELRYLLGLVYGDLGLTDRAIAEMGRAVERLPQSPLPRIHLGLLLTAAGQAEDAINTLNPLLSPDASEPQRLFHGGLVALARNDLAGCVAQLERGLETSADEAVNVLLQRVVKGAREALAAAPGGQQPMGEQPRRPTMPGSWNRLSAYEQDDDR